MIALRRAILMKADPVVSLHAPSRGLKWENKPQAKKVYCFTLTNEKTVCFIYYSKLKVEEPTEIFQASEVKL